MEPRYDEIRSAADKLHDMGVESNGSDLTLDPFRAALGGVDGVPVIVAGGYDGTNSNEVLEQGKADAIAYGRYFTSK
jgi:2,4-dienoyl-CoA reductase-like NADH-dependent reductase (Old Yellow Enzyme family)